MNRPRARSAALGIAALAGALAFALIGGAPPLAGDLFLALGALVFGLFAAGAVRRRRAAPLRTASFDATERRHSYARPGTGDGADNGGVDNVAPETYVATRRLTDRREIRPLAVDVLTRARNCSEAEAHRRLDEGTWTDDDYAAAFFSQTHAGDLYDAGVLARALGRRPTRDEITRRAIRELARVDDGVDG